MFHSPKHAQIQRVSPARRRIAGVAVAGATVAVGSVATAQSASADGVWDDVAQCESTGNWSINTGNGFYGGLQFTTQTWQGFGGGQYAPNAHQATKGQQIEIAQKVLQTQGPGAWPKCSQVAGLTEANGMTGGAPADEQQEEEAPQQEEQREEAPEAASRSTERAAEPQQEQEAPQQQEAPQEQEQEAPQQQEAPAPEGNGAELAVDGILGPNTTTAIEQWVGGSVDHGNTDLSENDIELLQAKVGAAQTGDIDANTITALQEVVGANTDGIWGPQTTSGLQTYLNGVL